MNNSNINNLRNIIKVIRKYDSDFPIQYLDVFLLIAKENYLGNKIKQCDIAKELNMSACAVSRAIGYLGEIGPRGKVGLNFVESECDIMDRRIKYLKMTSCGATMMYQIDSIISLHIGE